MSCRKFQLDYNTAILTAHEDGIEKGERREKIATIHFCEGLLQRPPTPIEQLAGLSLDELARFLTDLQSQLTKRE